MPPITPSAIRKVAVIAAIITALGTVLYLWTTYSLYRFTVSGGDSYTLYKDVSAEKSKVFSLFGVSLIPKNTDFIEVSGGDKLTRQAIFNKPWFGIKSEHIALRDQYKVEKVGSSSAGCDARFMSDPNTYTYNCFGSHIPLVKFANKKQRERNNSVAYEDEIFYSDSKIYLNGILSVALLESQTAKLHYRSPTGELKQTLDLGSVNDTIQEYRIFSNNHVEQFILYDSTNRDVLFFEDGLMSDYKKMSVNELTGTDEDMRLTDCSFTNNQTVCYFTAPPEDHNHNEDEAPLYHEDEPTEGILVYGIGSNQEVNKIPYAFEKVCSQGDTITAFGNETIYSFTTSTPQNITTLDYNVRALNCDGASIAYIKSHAVFEVDGTASYMLFNIDRFSLSNVTTQYDGSIMFTTFLAGNESQVSDQILHSYLINKDVPIEDTSKRLEHILPYNTINLPVYSIDYDSESIYINPHVSVISDRQTGQTIINEDILRSTKIIIEDQLRKDGLLDRLNIVYL